MLRLFFKTFSIMFILMGNAQLIIGCLKGSNHNFGFMDPHGDNFFKVNTSHTFQCSLHHHVFTVNNTTVHANCSDLKVSINSRELTTRCINPLTVEFDVNNATTEDSGYYICKAHKTLICMSSYLFGYEPQPVNNFTCISEAFLKLRCSWNRTKNKIPTNYSLTYMADYLDFNLMALACPQNTSKSQAKDWCEWTLNTPQIYYRNANMLFFRLTGVNTLGTWVKTYAFKHHEIIRAGPPTKLTKVEIGKNYANINWTHPNEMPLVVSPPVTYELGYKADGYENNFTTEDVGINVFEKRIELIPNLKYSIRLRCRVINATDLWSDYISDSFKTLSDVPYKSPTIINQSFDVKNFDTGYRSITLYWQGIDKKNCNGENCKYIIYVSVTNVARRKRANYEKIKEVDFRDTFATFSNLMVNEDYQFLIKTKNKEGESKASTRIVVPKKNMIPYPPNEVAASSDDEGYNVTWKPHFTYNNGEIVGYTVAKCRVLQPRPRDGTCAGEIEWFQLPADAKSHFFEINDKHVYNFAVAANNKFGSSSGLEWVPCIVPYNKVLEKIKNVRVHNKSSSELKIIENLDCRASYAVVKYFNISYSHCPTECSHNPHHCVDIKYKRLDLEPELILDNLEPFTSYSIRIAVVVDAGTSEYSDPVCATTNPAAPADPPRDSHLINITAHSATVLWQPPAKPNGIITKYMILGGPKDINFVPKNVYGKDEILNVTVANLAAYHEYTIVIQACVNGDLCKATRAKRFKTGISEPGVMERPDLFRNKNTSVTVEWKPPLNPNGPIDSYILYWRREHASENESYVNEKNVSGNTTSLLLDIECESGVSAQRANPFLFTIRAVNKLNGTLLYGHPSPPNKESLCTSSEASLSSLTIGLTIGAVLALVPLSVILYILVRWMRDKVQNMKNVGGVELPPGLLNSPHSNPTSSYENFKNGLQCNPDASPKPAYGRLDSFISNDDSFKNRHGSGTSQFSATSTDELITKQNIIAEKTKRNPSGDSSGCGSTGGHDSLSSSLTHRTNLSSDSGNEADIKNPPSPEVARESEETVTKPEEKSLNVSCVSGSKDSGVDKGDDSDEKSKSPVSPYSQFSSCVDSSNKALGSYSPPAPYSKFGIEQSCYVPISRGRNLQLYGHNLANSEPSINEMDEVNPYSCIRAEPRLDGTILEPVMAAQYSKLGLSRSIQDILGCKSFILDRNRALMENGSKIEEGAMLPYSRFGMRRVESPSNINNPYITVGMAFSMVDKNPKEFLRKKENEIPWLPDVALLRKNKSVSPGKVDLLDEGFENSEPVEKDNMAYSKIGLGEADYAANKNFNLAIKPFEAPSTSKPREGYVGLDDLKIYPISQLVANSENSKDLKVVEAESRGLGYDALLSNSTQKVDDGGGIAPYSCIIPSLKGDQEEIPEPFSLQNLDNIYTPPSYDDLDENFTPAKLPPSGNGYVSQDVLLQNSKRNLDRTSFNSRNPSNELLPKPELKENRLPDVNVKRSNGYVSVSELPSICGGKDVRFNMPITDV